jgi:uncharacterized protein YjbJ (UPF0337 family)
LPLVPPEPASAEYPIDKERVKGRVSQATGKVKEETGKAMDDTSLTIRGKAEKAGGKARSTLGVVKNDVKSDTKKSSR